MEPSPPANLLGAQVPGGTFHLAALENWLTHYAFYSTPDPRPHPMVTFIAAQRGMGFAVDELFAMLQFDINDGPLLAECVVDFHHEVREGATYQVSGRVESVQRKRGRKLGEFDLVTCVFELLDSEPGGLHAATVTNIYALPRGEVTSP